MSRMLLNTNSANEWLTLQQAATMCGLCLTTFKYCRNYWPEFPASEFDGHRQLRINRAKVEAWIQGKDIAALVKLANRQRRKAPAREAKESAFNHAASQFISGHYLPTAQRERIELKKLVARSTQPKTYRVTLVPDWMSEDRSNV